MSDTGRSAVFHIRRAEVEVIDTWDSLGLRATASHDLAVEGTIVPGHRISFLDGPAHTDEPAARFPVFGLLAAGIGAVAIGVGQAAIVETIELAGGKTPTGSKRRLADRGSVQETVARSQADLEAAWTYLAAVATDGSGRADLEQKVRLRLAATKAMETGRDVVDRLYTGGRRYVALRPLAAAALSPRPPHREPAHDGGPAHLGADRTSAARPRGRSGRALIWAR